MQTFTIVRTEHLNHYGYLFGGQLLKWVDEYAWLVAAKEFAGQFLVTRAMESIDFKESIVNGSILRFDIRRAALGRTSVTYAVDVYADEPGGKRERFVFSNKVTFVRVSPEGEKTPLDPPVPISSEGSSSAP